MAEYCPRCNRVRNVRVERVPVLGEEKGFVWETLHCLVCGTFIRNTKQNLERLEVEEVN